MTAPQSEPPRWFKPAVFGAMLATIVVVAAIAAELGHDRAKPVAAGERAFAIPAGHLSAVSHEEPLFVRVKPPGRAYEIVHDARAAGRHDRAGVPHIFSVNDGDGHDVRYRRVGRTLVACRRASAPIGGCGTWIDYGGATWAVLFPESRIGEAERFAREVPALLRSYDTRPLRLGL